MKLISDCSSPIYFGLILIPSEPPVPPHPKFVKLEIIRVSCTVLSWEGHGPPEILFFLRCEGYENMHPDLRLFGKRIVLS